MQFKFFLYQAFLYLQFQKVILKNTQGLNSTVMIQITLYFVECKYVYCLKYMYIVIEILSFLVSYVTYVISLNKIILFYKLHYLKNKIVFNIPISILGWILILTINLGFKSNVCSICEKSCQHSIHRSFCKMFKTLFVILVVSEKTLIQEIKSNNSNRV